MPPQVVQFLHVRRDHFGPFAGIQRVIPFIDRDRYEVRVRQVHDGDDDFPTRPLVRSAVRALVRRFVQERGQPWYKLSDLAAECALLHPWSRGEIDILHYLDGEHTARYLPRVSGRWRRRGRAIATYHQPSSILRDVVVPSVIRRLDHVVLVASSQQDYFSQVVPASRLSVVLHGVDTEFFHRRAVRTSDGVFRCVVVGSYLRDWDLLGLAAERLHPFRDIELVVVSATAPSFERLSNVRVHRGIGDEALRSVYCESDAALLPLTDGTANNALLEAMAMGLPIIASDLPSVREYAGRGPVLFLPQDPQRFAEAIVGLKEDSRLRWQMGAASRQRAEALSWSRVARSQEAVYARV